MYDYTEERSRRDQRTQGIDSSMEEGHTAKGYIERDIARVAKSGARRPEREG